MEPPTTATAPTTGLGTSNLTPEMLVRAAFDGFHSHDPLFVKPFVDQLEWREEPVPHLYLHGGYEDTDHRLSMYLPPASRYEGRFFQVVLPISGTEHAATLGLLGGMGGSIGFAADSGAILLESNMGRPSPDPGPDPTIPGYRGSAVAARFARAVAAAVYGPHRPFGYVYGGSGGAFKTIACVEQVPDVWDGAVPFVQGCPMSIPNSFAAQAHAMRVLRRALPSIVDALEPGGSGDIYAGLDTTEREALAEATRFGIPPGIWFDANRVMSSYTTMWAAFAAPIRAADPSYFDDFWNVPGYLGHDQRDSLLSDRVVASMTVVETITASRAGELGLPLPMSHLFGGGSPEAIIGLRVDSLPESGAFGAVLEVDSGVDAGLQCLVSSLVGDIVCLNGGIGGDLTGITAGDRVTLDNSDYLAFQSLPRHQVADGYVGFEQYVEGGRPIFPQRARLIGPKITRGTWGHHQSGRFRAKVISVASMWDEAAYPWQADWYRRQVEAVHGAAVDEHHRIWFVEHAMHGSPSPMVVPGDLPRPSRLTRTVDYCGLLEQAVRDVVKWVEFGIAPPANSNYDLDGAQVRLHGWGDARGGIQPTAALTVDGRDVIRTRVGAEVKYEGRVAVPAGTGTVVAVEFDFLGDGDFPHRVESIDGTLPCLEVAASFRFEVPGTYFSCMRVTSHRNSDLESPYARVQNIARVRVIVE